MPELMVWPPKVLESREGEVTGERPSASADEASAVVPGAAFEAGRAPAQRASAQPPPAQHPPPQHFPGPHLPGATVSVMAATAVPRDWLERPEGLIGCVLGSRYRITGVIGRGPMGIACEGESSRGRQVTLKLLPRAPELPVEHFAWQVRQALALAHFDHPHVTPISDFGALEDGGAFVSRARVPGVTLRTIVRQGALPIGRALEIARQVATALGAGHRQEIAHGRLKPENIIIQGGERPGDVVKVVDFGMAGLPVNLRAVAPDENEALRLALRTRLYLPASVTGASPAIDVYSLGVILFEMLAGQPPFVFESLPPAGAQPMPLSFAQCNPSLVVPAPVNELVFALLHPRAAEQGLSAQRASELLGALLGLPSVVPAAEPVTSPMPSAHGQGPQVEGATASLSPGAQGFGAPSTASLVWPSSPPLAPAGAHSFPPLPQGFASSIPPALERPGSEPGRGGSLPPSSGPPARSSAPHPPPPPSARRPPSLIDEPFATPSFPPPNLIVPKAPPSPNVSVATGAPSSLPPRPSPADELEMELRPSLIGRLKRLFGKKRPGEF